MNQPADTRLSQDSCSYNEKLRRTTGPGLYALNVPYNDCTECKGLPFDPSLRYQYYGHNTCTMESAIDDSSELLGLNYKSTKCNKDEYQPMQYKPTGGCVVQGTPRKCMAPREDTRLSNPPCTLRGTGINRWQWLCYDPQDTAIEDFNRIPVHYRMVVKDNHVPLIETPIGMSADVMHSPIDMDDLTKWQKGDAQNEFAPGNPNGFISYNIKCM